MLFLFQPEAVSTTTAACHSYASLDHRAAEWQTFAAVCLSTPVAAPTLSGHAHDSKGATRFGHLHERLAGGVDHIVAIDVQRRDR